MGSPKLAAVFLSFTSYNLDITGDYRQGLFFGVVNVSLLGYNLIILYSSFSFFYYPAAGPSFFYLRYTNHNTTNQTRSLPSTLNCKINSTDDKKKDQKNPVEKKSSRKGPFSTGGIRLHKKWPNNTPTHSYLSHIQQ